jgi:hypothetical protein
MHKEYFNHEVDDNDNNYDKDEDHDELSSNTIFFIMLGTKNREF